MIQEYRKASAEALKVKERIVNTTGRIFCQYPDNKESTFGEWQPEEDANQTLMVWEWMQKNGRKWIEILRDIFWEYGHGITNDIKFATMKAFMENI